jgi:hypothetical protein
MASQTPLDSPVLFCIRDSQTHQAAVTSTTSKDRVMPQVIIEADIVRICVCAGCSWFAVSSVSESLPCVENPAYTTGGSGALLQSVC